MSLALTTPYPNVTLPAVGAFYPAAMCYTVNTDNGNRTDLRPEEFATAATAQTIANALQNVTLKEALMAGPYAAIGRWSIVFSDGSYWNAGWAAMQILLKQGFTKVGGEFVGEDLSFAPPPTTGAGVAPVVAVPPNSTRPVSVGPFGLPNPLAAG